jgi:hypothetical protein
MAETLIPIVKPIPNANGQVITTAAVDTTNGNYCPNGGSDIIYHFKNTHASGTITITATIPADSENNTTPKTLLLTAGQYGTMGPYKDNSVDGIMHFTAVAGSSGTGVCYATQP